MGPCIKITQEDNLKGKKWWAWKDSNLRPADSLTLSVEAAIHDIGCKITHITGQHKYNIAEISHQKTRQHNGFYPVMV